MKRQGKIIWRINMTFATYLKFNGQCEKAFHFYKKIFQAEQLCFFRYEKGLTQDAALMGLVFHAEMKIKNFYLYMGDVKETIGSDHPAFKIVLECDTSEEGNQYFSLLQENGKVLSPLEKMPYGPYIGELLDQFGVIWDIVFEPKM
jgi:PhnB protein